VILGSLRLVRGIDLLTPRARPQSAVMMTAIQMLVGGVFVGVIGIMRGELATFHIAAVSARSFAAWVYLLIVGSLIGFTAFVFLLRVSTAARVATYAYVNPVVAVILGWLLASEAISARMLVAAAIIVGGVALITASRRDARRRRRCGAKTACQSRPATSRSSKAPNACNLMTRRRHTPCLGHRA
jgi:drug/metabolite transporter (DMT)-like permease